MEGSGEFVMKSEIYLHLDIFSSLSALKSSSLLQKYRAFFKKIYYNLSSHWKHCIVKTYISACLIHSCFKLKKLFLADESIFHNIGTKVCEMKIHMGESFQDYT